MRLSFRLLQLSIVLWMLSLISPSVLSVPKTHAASFSDIMVRLNRLSPNTPLQGVICATPSSPGAGIEQTISVTFPPDFSLDTNPSSWTTGTTGIPTGSTPWPSINPQAVSVTGSTVTFLGSDLTGNNQYCFTFSALSSSTGNAGQKTGTLATRTNTSTPIDTSMYALTITDDLLTVSATVPAQPTDLSASLTQNPSGTTVGKDTLLQYELTYASSLPYPSSITVEASWTNGTIKGASVPTIPIVSYESGSSSNGYGNIPAVIDPVNQTITWTIPNFPANNSQTVSFALRTSNIFVTELPITFSVNARVLGPGTSSLMDTITNTYLFNYSPSLPPGPTSTPGPQATPTPTPIPTFYLSGVSVRSLTQNEARIGISLSFPGTLRLTYGTNPSALTEDIIALTPSSFQLLTLPNLMPNTRYYFKIFGNNDNGSSFISDLYTFQTARISDPVTIAPDSFIATSENNLIFTFSDRKRLQDRNIIVLPTDTRFEVQFGFTEDIQPKAITLLLRNNHTLGSVSTDSEPDKKHFPVLEVKPGIYAGSLNTGETEGTYVIVAKISDTNGNITEDILSEVKVSNPFRIIRKDDTKPLEHAKVRLFIYNEKEKVYKFIHPSILPIPNPSYSDRIGRVSLILPMGRYRAEISHFGYENQTVDFTVGPNPTEDYPLIYMERSPFTIMQFASYLVELITDSVYTITSFLENAGSSGRTFTLIGFLTIICFAFLTLLALSEKTHVKLRRLPVYFLSLLQTHHKEREKTHTYRGIVLDGLDRRLLPGVDIFVSDTENDTIVFHTKSTKEGKVIIPLPPKDSYVLELQKVGFHTATVPLMLFNGNEIQTFALLGHESNITPHRVLKATKALLAALFEAFLLLLLVLCIVYGLTVGLLPVLPFIFLALFNMIFWMLHMIHHNS